MASPECRLQARLSPPKPVWVAVGVLAAALLVRPPSAAAHARGIVASSCDGCHGAGGTPPDLTVAADRATFNPGDSVTLTLTIRGPSIRVGGAFITTAGVGALQPLPGEGLAVNAQGLTHTAPKAAVNGAVTFRFGWQAPSKPGAVDFWVAALAGNGSNSSTGDTPGSGEFQWVFGCNGRSFYLDLDRDGYGAKNLGTRLGCDGDPAPTGYATMDGDCDENDEKVYPGATEICDMKDDDCNGQIDENAPAVMMWPDGDGDGYYKFQTGTAKIGCGNLPGYAARSGDCDDTDPTIHPGTSEICNLRDDNCDGQIDERVRPICGVGWCARYSWTCDLADCGPGPPAVETCNSFDDDCDGEDDNGACPAGMFCAGSQCVASGGGAGPTGGIGGSASGSGSASGTGGNAAGGRGGERTGSGCAVAAPASGRPTDGSSDCASWVAIAIAARCRRRSARA